MFSAIWEEIVSPVTPEDLKRASQEPTWSRYIGRNVWLGVKVAAPTAVLSSMAVGGLFIFQDTLRESYGVPEFDVGDISGKRLVAALVLPPLVTAMCDRWMEAPVKALASCYFEDPKWREGVTLLVSTLTVSGFTDSMGTIMTNFPELPIALVACLLRKQGASILLLYAHYFSSVMGSALCLASTFGVFILWQEVILPHLGLGE